MVRVLQAILAADACCLSIFWLGLLAVSWWFREIEPERWRRMARRPALIAALVVVGIGGTVAFVACSPPANRMLVLGLVAIPPLLASLVMGVFFGRLNHPKGKPAPDSDLR
jgi:hypothetical protein